MSADETKVGHGFDPKPWDGARCRVLVAQDEHCNELRSAHPGEERPCEPGVHPRWDDSGICEVCHQFVGPAPSGIASCADCGDVKHQTKAAGIAEPRPHSCDWPLVPCSECERSSGIAEEPGEPTRGRYLAGAKGHHVLCNFSGSPADGCRQCESLDRQDRDGSHPREPLSDRQLAEAYEEACATDERYFLRKDRVAQLAGLFANVRSEGGGEKRASLSSGICQGCHSPNSPSGDHFYALLEAGDITRPWHRSCAEHRLAERHIAPPYSEKGWRQGAGAMREAAGVEADRTPLHTGRYIADRIRALPIPEPPK